MSNKTGECVRVMVRIRPMSSKEKQDGRETVAIANFKRAEISVKNPASDGSEPPKCFTFDAAFGSESTQQQVYDTAAAEIVEAVMDGYNGTIFAYGQTGAGKSHTMEGYPDPADLRGIIPNSFKHIFDKVGIAENKQFLVRASYLEIYNEEIRDLLSKDPKNRLDIKENADSGVYVKELTSFVVKDAAEIDHVMQAGKKNRSVGATLMNQTSSRSHSIFTIVVECASSKSDGTEHICVGKLNLVDLAGSERQSKTGATGDRLKEATKINLSLSALGNVISALVDGKSQHIPYRDSKLTRLLQDSLGGNTKTVMIANCGPADYNYEETVTTLRYASRAKQIKNKPKINEDPKDAMLREFQEEIQLLKEKLALAQKESMEGGSSSPFQGAGEPEIIERVEVKEVIEPGISPEQLKAIEDRTEREKKELLSAAEKEKERIAIEKKRTEHKNKEMLENIEKEKKNREDLAKQQEILAQKLVAMQTKLIVGGKMKQEAAKQADALRQAKLELDERKRQELALARELAEKEEANLMMEEQYKSLEEEAEAKTKKLKKVWMKYKQAASEIKELQQEFDRERGDMLDTIRELTSQLKLKNVVLDYFMPPHALAMIEQTVKWSDETDNWNVPRLDLTGNHIRPRQRPASASGIKRPEVARRFSLHDETKQNLATEFMGVSPFLAYSADDGDEGQGGDTGKSQSKKKTKTSTSKRPSTAGRQQRTK